MRQTANPLPVFNGKMAHRTEVALIVDSGDSSGVSDRANDTSTDGLEDSRYHDDADARDIA